MASSKQAAVRENGMATRARPEIKEREGQRNAKAKRPVSSQRAIMALAIGDAGVA